MQNGCRTEDAEGEGFLEILGIFALISKYNNLEDDLLVLILLISHLLHVFKST